MAYYIKPALQRISSLLQTSGRFKGGVMLGVPKGAPNTPAAAIFLARGSAGTLSTTSSIRRREVVVRIYLERLAEPRDETETDLEEALYDTEADIMADLNLADTGWELAGGEWDEAFDYEDISNKPFRTADIILPLLHGE